MFFKVYENKIDKSIRKIDKCIFRKILIFFFKQLIEFNKYIKFECID